MASVTEQILARIQTVLSGAAIVPSGHVARGREERFGDDEIPALNIRRMGTLLDAETFETDRQRLSLTIQILVAGPAGETAADALHTSVHAALMADSVLQQIGHHSLRHLGTDTEADVIEQPFFQLNCHYEIDAWVSRGELT